MDCNPAIVFGSERLSDTLLLHWIRATVFQFQVTANFMCEVIKEVIQRLSLSGNIIRHLRDPENTWCTTCGVPVVVLVDLGDHS